jgi:hypothetical protein
MFADLSLFPTPEAAMKTIKSIRLDPNDYGQLTSSLMTRLKTRAPVGYERGRIRMREHLEKSLECTPTRARHLVTSLVDRGYVRFGPHPRFTHDHTVGQWTYHPAGRED